jgi:tetratricopeptide (TPR) repeat protein
LVIEFFYRGSPNPLLQRYLIIAVFAASIRAQTPVGGCDFDAALRLHQAGDLTAAAAGYEACLTAQPGRVDARSNLGAVFVKMGRYQDAIGEYLEALKTAGSDVAPRLRFNLALAYYKSLQIPAAADELETLHAAQPADLNLALLLADCRLRMGEFQKAVDVVAPLEAAHAKEPALNYVLGMALIRLGRVADGQIRVDRILRQGDSAEGHFLLGSALFGAGNYPAAVKELNQAAVLNPEVPSLQSYLGQALLFTGDADSAVKAFRKELAANPNDYDANFQLASILAHRGQTDESRRLLERATQVRPGSAEARAALAGGFHFEQAAAGDAGGDPGIPAGAAAPPVGTLTFAGSARPVVLVFGSYTCPKLRSSAADLKRIAAQYHERVDFRLVYISEAHANGGAESQWQSSINQKEGIDLPAARNLAEKQDHAELCVRRLTLPFGVVVDGMDSAAERAYQAWPSRLYVVGRDGKVAFQTRLGELDFHADDLERAIREILARREADVRLR